eukprot:jgi/Botrbrau1/9480/Bobra.0252s0098.2
MVVGPTVCDRIPYDEIRNMSAKPYLLGASQRPQCSNCYKDELWSHFCQFRSHGPVCNPWDQTVFQSMLVERAELGAPGYRDMLTFTPCDMFRYIRGRTLWLVGDSMQQEFMRGVQCFFYEFWDLQTRTQDVSFGGGPAVIGRTLGGWCVEMPESTRICHLRSNLGDWLAHTLLPLFPALGVKRTDVMVLNFAIWINSRQEYERNVSAFANYYQAHKEELPFTIWRDSSVQHFDTPTGDYQCDGCPSPSYPFICQAIPNVTLNDRNELEADAFHVAEVVAGGWRNRIALPVMEQLGIPIMHTWNTSLPIFHFHHNFQEKDDCTHFCHPSPYQMWIWDMYKVLQAQYPNILARNRTASE